MAKAGVVWIDVLPSMKGWNAAVRAQSAVSLVGTGEAAGKGFTAGLTRMMRIGLGGMKGQVAAQARIAAEEAANAVTAATAKVTAARAREEAAAGKVRVAELKLQEVRAKANASASSVAAAEERLATAERAHGIAAEGAATAQSALVRAEERATTASAAVGTAAVTSGGRVRAMGSTVAGSMDRMGSKVGHFAKVAGGMAGLFAGFEVAKFAGESVKAASEFQKSTNVLVTAAGESVKNLATIRKGLVNISNETGTGTDQLSEGMYTIEKAGIRGAKGLKVLSAAAKGAREENANLGTVTNAMTSIMNSYGIGAGHSVQVMNELKTAAANSKTTMENFAGSLSTVLPIAAANHISFAKVAGALGTLTSHGTSADEATQELANSIRNLSAPNAVAIKEMGQLGISSQKVSMSLGKKGVLGTVQGLSQTILKQMGPSGKVLLNTFYQSTSAGAAAEQMFGKLSPAAQKLAKAYDSGTMSYKAYHKAAKALDPEQYSQIQQWTTLANRSHGFNDAIKQGLPGTQTYSAAMKKMMGGSTGLNTALMLLGTSASGTQRRINAISKSYKDNATEVEGWKATQQTAAVASDRMKESIKNAGMVMATAFLPTLTKVTTGVANAVTGFMKFAQTHKWVGTLAKALVIAGAVLAALTVTVWLATAAVTALTTAFAVLTSPITLVIAAIAAIGVGLVLAYKKVGWFRDAVNGAWSFIKSATLGLVHFFEGPFLGFFTKTLPGVFHTTTHAVTGAFDSVASAGRWLWDKILHPIFDALSKAWHAVGTAFRTVYDGWIFPVIDLVGAIVRVLWRVTVNPILGYIRASWHDLGTSMHAVYTTVIHPTISGLGVMFNWLWRNVASPAISGLKALWSGLGTAFRWTYDHVIHPAFDLVKSGFTAMGNGLQWAYDHTIHPLFRALGSAVSGLKHVFKLAVDAIGSQWGRIKALATAPIRFVIDTIIDGGLIGTFNKIAGFFHTAKMKEIHPFGLAGGGTVQGQRAPYGDKVLAMLAPGEEVISNRHGQADRFRALRAAGLIPGLADGGSVLGKVWGGVKSAASGVWGGIKDAASWAMHAVSDPAKFLKGAISGLMSRIGGGDWGRLLAAVPGRIIEAMVSKVGSLFGGSGGSGKYMGGGNFSQWFARAIAVAGGNWAQYRNAASIVAHYESGDNPNVVNRWDSNALRGTPSAGLMQFIQPTFDAYAWPGHHSWMNPVDQILAFFRYTTARYGSPNNTPGVRSVSHGGPYMGYANGGRPRVGVASVVGERGPELFVPDRPGTVLSNPQSRAAFGMTDAQVEHFASIVADRMGPAVTVGTYHGSAQHEREVAVALQVASRGSGRSGLVGA